MFTHVRICVIKRRGVFMKKYYVNGEKITFDPHVFNSGEEGNLYLYRKDYSHLQLVKIFNPDRRLNLATPDEDFYRELTSLQTEKFYLPKDIVHDEEGIFAGCVVDYFEDGTSFTSAQSADICSLIKELKLLEKEIDYLSEHHICISDMKIAHILYHYMKCKIGVVDTGLWSHSDDGNLKLENYKVMNYYLRSALLWMNTLGTEQEMLSIDLPEVFDLVDEVDIPISSILEEECSKHNVSSVAELKKIYKQQKFY